MQDEQMQQNQKCSESEPTEQLVESLGNLWQHAHELSSERLKRISRFVACLPEDAKAIGLRAIAQHIANDMSLHYLDIMATFQERAEQEGIDAEEVAATFADVLPESFLAMMELSQQVSVRSLDDLVTLSNITIGSYGLSQADSAEDAQGLIYSLPKLYYCPLERKHLLAQPPETPDSTVKKNMLFMPLEDPSSDSMRASIEPDQTESQSAA